METTVQKNTLYEEDDVLTLETNARVRKALINQLTSNGTKAPEDKSDKVFLLGLLDGSDKQVFNKVKVKQNDKNNESLTNATEMIATVLKQIRAPQRKPRPVTLSEPEGTIFREPVPGEIEIGMIPLKPEDIMEI